MPLPTSSIRIDLPAIPANVNNPTLQRELGVIYNALHNLHKAVTASVGATEGGATAITAVLDSATINLTLAAQVLTADLIMGADDNYVTDAEKAKLSNLSGTNSGDNATNTYYDPDADGVVDYAESIPVTCRNPTGVTIPAMSVVYITGAIGQTPTIALALASSEATSSQTIGVTGSAIANNATGRVITIGVLHNVNTSAFADGNFIYLSPTVAGGMTATKPYAPNHMVLIGIVAYAHATQGKLVIRVANGFELDEIHNVAIAAVADKNLLAYDAATSLWKNVAGLGAANGVATLDASSLIPLTQIPPAAIERLVVVANQTARYALTTATVQNGDTVKQTDTGEMWYVIDQTNLGNSAGYAVYTAGTASAVAVGGITGLGTGVATALAVNVGTAGAPVVNGGALGTPSSGVTDNLTTATTATAIADTDFVDTNLAAGGKRKILWTAVKTYLASTFAALAGSATQSFTAQRILATGASALPSVVANNAGGGISLISGHDTTETIGGATPYSQIHNITGYSLGMFRWIANSAGVRQVTLKSRSSTPGTRTSVVTGDNLYQLDSYGVDSTSADALAARMLVECEGTVSGAGVMPGRYSFWTANAAGVLTEALKIDSAQLVTALHGLTVEGVAITANAGISVSGAGVPMWTSSASGGIGYSTGAGDTVTQLTSKATTVTLTKFSCGKITTHNAALAANAVVTFGVSITVPYQGVGSINVVSGEATRGSYHVQMHPSSAGSSAYYISIRNLTAGSLSEALVLHFAFIKHVSA